jgi:two-component system, NtrC family, sensor histidine kinase HydH
VLIALILGVVLVGSSALSFRDARQTADMVAEGQGIRFLRRLDVALGRERARPPALATLLEANRSLGLTYVGLFEHDQAVAEAGAPLLAGSPVAVGAPAFGHGRVRMVGGGPHGPPPGASGPPPPPPPPPGGQRPWPPGEPAPEDMPAEGAPPGGHPPPPWSHGDLRPPPHPSGRQVIIEFEPITSEDAVRRALTVLWLSSSAAGLLMLAALILWSGARRAELVEDQMRAQRHLAQLGEMSAVLAHEIRNPLAALKGHAQLLAERVHDEVLAPRVDRVVREAIRLEQLTNGLLEFARSGTIDLLLTSPGAILERAANATVPDRIERRADGAPAMWALDPARMEQVLINLLENALSVTPAPGKIIARVTGDDGQLCYSVQDLGPGIPAAERPRIFEPFHTTKTHGTGLGLAVSRRIVELHGGRIDVGDAPGGGAILTVRLPRREARQR